MPDRKDSLVLTSLAFAAGIIFAHLAGPRIADAQNASPAPPPSDVTSRVSYLERAYKGVYTDIQTLKSQVKALQGGGQAGGGQRGGPVNAATLAAKVTELEKKLDGHTHEYLQEGRASDGSIRAVPPDQFSGQGLNSTGLFRVGKPVFNK
jgi:hypothetical protein